jgi:type II secretory pathway pseudopilin PulG
MGTAIERGFTVIELMLFLGISGALFAGLMIGVNNSISQERYRESVVSLSTLVQNQYNEVTNTRNDRTNSYACDTDAKVSANSDPSSAKVRGASDCVLLGKIIEIKNGGSSDNGGSIDIMSVVGYAPCDPNDITCNANEGSDIDVLAKYKPRVTSFDKDTSSVEWGSRVLDVAQGHNNLTANIAILRSPASGLVRVFWNKLSPIADQSLVADTSDPDSLVGANNSAKPLTMCMLGDSIIAARQSITINPAIGGPDAVSVNQVDSATCA